MNHQLDRDPIFLAEANCFVRFSRCFLARLRQSQTTTRKMKAQPNAISKISHHASWRFVTVLVDVGVEIPVTEGRAAEALPLLLLTLGTVTNSDRQAPKPDTTLEEF